MTAMTAEEYAEYVYEQKQKPTLRDQFAMAALTGMLSGDNTVGARKYDSDYADAAYQVADAMLKERAKVGE